MEKFAWLSAEVKLLMTAGLGGSIVRILIAPDKQWQRWIVQVFIGSLAAVFIGGFAAHLIIKVIGEDAHIPAYLAVGFIIGSAAERAIEKFQDKILG